MSAAQLMSDLARMGIKIEAHGDRLRYSPRSAVTPELAGRMKALKAELMIIVAPEQSGGNTVCDDDTNWWERIEGEDRRRLRSPRDYPYPCRYCGCRSRHWSRCPTRFDDELTTVPQGQFRGRRLDDCPASFLHQLMRAGRRWASPELQNEARRIIYLRKHFGTTE